jgi:hypothetical protein
VLVTLNVQRQVAGLFVAEEQGARELIPRVMGSDRREPIRAFR